MKENEQTKYLHGQYTDQGASELSYGRGVRCVASECIAYEPFPPAKIMVPHSNRRAKRIGQELAARTKRDYPKMSFVTRTLHPVWKNHCDGCNACVVYCPRKAVQWSKPPAYRQLKGIVAHKLKLPETRTRYHHPDVAAADLVKDGIEPSPEHQ